MNADVEQWPPPDDPTAFESLCLDLWKDIWDDPGAQKNGRAGQPQAGVDVFGWDQGRLVGVQCKQRRSLLRTRVRLEELETEVKAARRFKPSLSTFVLATTGPRDAKAQERARQLTYKHQRQGLFAVEVWAWDDIWHELYQRSGLLARIAPIYWPALAAVNRDKGKLIAPTRLCHGSEHLFGREEELKRLDTAWDDPGTHGVIIVAWGGSGKTSLVAEWMARQAATGWSGFECVFDWSFYSQGIREEGAPPADQFVDAALRFFGDADPTQGSLWDRGGRLGQLLAERRALLVLDGIEPLQHPPGPMAGRIRDPSLESLLKGLAQLNSGLCVVTTREGLADLDPWMGKTITYLGDRGPEGGKYPHLCSLPIPAGIELLKSLGVRGTEVEFRRLVEQVAGHALTLQLLGRYLKLAHDGDIRMRQSVRLEEVNKEVQGGHAFRVMSAYEKWLASGGDRGVRQLAILYLLGVFDRPADADCLAALRRTPAIPGLTEFVVNLSDAQWNTAVSRLAECGLLSRGGPESRRIIDAHPLVREYFANQLREKNPAAWCVAHRRLYEHLRDSSKDKPEPSLEDLQPLYQAVAHACQARRYQEALDEVYWPRILRGDPTDGSYGKAQFYSTSRLGAFGAELAVLRLFFDEPWGSLVVDIEAAPARAFLKRETGYVLRGLGRLQEARICLGGACEDHCRLGQWREATVSSGILSHLHMYLGDLANASRQAEKTVRLADCSGDPIHRANQRAMWAEVLHNMGKLAEAEEKVREGEEVRASVTHPDPVYWSYFEFDRCDLLLSKGCYWEALRGARKAVSLLRRAGLKDHFASALSQMSVGRSLARLRVQPGKKRRFSRAAYHLDRAVEGLRRAGREDELPRGLLARAVVQRFSGDYERAEADVAEAKTMVQRSGMRLYECDCHLEFGRLCVALAESREGGTNEDLSRAKLSLSRAEEMVRGMGYYRRAVEVHLAYAGLHLSAGEHREAVARQRLARSEMDNRGIRC